MRALLLLAAFGVDHSILRETPRVETAPERTRIVMVTASWDTAGRQWLARERPFLESGGWRIGILASDHVQIVDYRETAHRVSVVPTFVVVKGSKELRRQSGYLSAWGVYYLRHPEQRDRVRPSGGDPELPQQASVRASAAVQCAT